MSRLLRARSTSSMHEYVGAWRADKQSVALVPTMGNLHAGHLSLTSLAAGQADSCAVAGIGMMLAVRKIKGAASLLAAMAAAIPSTPRASISVPPASSRRIA